MGHTYGQSSIDTDAHRGVIREESAEIKSLKCGVNTRMGVSG